MLGGGRDKIPCLKGEQNLAGFRVKRLPSVLSFGTYKVPVTWLWNETSAFGAATSSVTWDSFGCGEQSWCWGSSPEFGFSGAGWRKECDGRSFACSNRVVNGIGTIWLMRIKQDMKTYSERLFEMVRRGCCMCRRPQGGSILFIDGINEVIEST